MSGISRRSVLQGAAFAPASALAQSSGAPAARRLLARSLTASSLGGMLVPRDQWKPFPAIADRDAWTAVAAPVREAVMAAAEPYLGKPYAPLPATLFLEYVRTGNRSHFENVQFGRRTHLRQLVLAECVEAKGRFLDDIADGVWTTCEETFWGIPAHIGEQKRGGGLPDVEEPIIDLFAAETGALLAWTDYLLGSRLDTVHRLIRPRLAYEIERRILAPYRDRHDFWWMGLDPRQAGHTMNNWNPWINSNCLAAVLLMDQDGARRAGMVHKIITSLDRFLDSYHDDGGCDEGPSYWSRAGGSLFDNLELLRSASAGALDYYSVPLVQEIGRYICRVHIAGDWFVNFADASAKIRLDGDLVYRYGAAIKDADMRALGAFAARRGVEAGDSLGRTLPAIFNYSAVASAPARQPFVRDAWLPGTQVAAARRQSGSAGGFYFAALGGHNAESHNHNDVGNFIVFLDGDPVLIDVGVETYTAKTFGPRRYEIWTMQSAYHNLPTINGVMQHEGRRYAARDTSFLSQDDSAEFSADIAAAYPAEAGVGRWRRSVRLDRTKNTIDVSDRFELRSASGRVDMNLMTPCPARQEGGALILAGGLLRTDTVRIAAAGPSAPAIRIEEIAITDARLRPVWGDKLYRVILSWSNLPGIGELKFGISAL